MTSPSDTHRPEHADMVALYAVGALGPTEIAAVEAQIAACVECRQELETLRPTVEAFVAWPTDVLRPSPRLWERVAQRIEGETPQSVMPTTASWAEPEWREVAPGISCKLLATDQEKQCVTMLVRLAPGTEYPPHRHEGVEELHLLDGELIVDADTFYPGDYRRAEPGSVDHRVWSETGCTCVLITSFRDAIL